MKLTPTFFFLLSALIPRQSVWADEAVSQPLSSSSVIGRAEHPIDELLDGPQSMYTEKLLQLVKDLPAARRFCQCETAPLGLHAIGMKTKDRPYYVGFKKCMVINAPLSAVEAVKDDVEHYGDLFPGFKEVKVVLKDTNRTVLSWEKEIPVFFVANIKYEINYLTTKPTPGIRLHRYQFRRGDRLKFNDGIEILEADGENRTLFTNYEFYEADYNVGLLGIKAAGADTVWKESLKGGYLSMLAIRMKSEHPEWSFKRLAKERDAAVKTLDVENIVYDDSMKSVPKSKK